MSLPQNVQKLLDDGYDHIFAGDFDRALRKFSIAFLKMNGQGEVLDSTHQESPFRFESTGKLRHDLEQMDYLLAKGRIGGKYDSQLKAGRDFLRRFERTHKNGDRFIVTPQLERELSAFLQGCFYAYRPRAQVSRAVNPIHETRTSGPVVLDDVLSPTALGKLRRFFVESAVWHDFKQGGYIGANLHSGLFCGLLLQVAAEIKEALPDRLGRLKLNRIFAYKYGTSGKGAPVHADPGRVSVSLWITPDEANLDPKSGGMVLFRAKAPKSWGHLDYNGRPWKVMKQISKSDKGTRIPYRCNRAVVFDSSRFHKSDRFNFAPGYENRRINVVFVYGDGNRLRI